VSCPYVEYIGHTRPSDEHLCAFGYHGRMRSSRHTGCPQRWTVVPAPGGSGSRRPAASRTRGVWVALVIVLVLAFVAPLAAFASRLPSDRVGQRPLSSATALRDSAPDVAAAAGMLTTGDGLELWSRAAHDPRAMASTTKMMTAVVVLERAKLSDEVTVSKAAAAVGESGVNLVQGERLTVRQLLEAMLVTSSNEAAIALAEHVATSTAAFAGLMNGKAAELGLVDTHFTNPHGLDAPGHHTSAADLAMLARYAMGNREFARIVALRRATIPGPKGATRVLENSNLLLGRYRGADGVKTGWTDEAGYCLVAGAKRGDVRLYAVVLGAASEQARFTQASRLLDWGFAHYRPVRVTSAEQTVGSVPVSDYLETAIVAVAGETTSVLVFDPDGALTRRVKLAASVAAPVRRGDRVGTLEVLQGSRTLATVPVVSAGSVDAPGFWERLRIWLVRTWRGWTG
jgi:D-alanyl-D-alanine carboxypeptidase (penicillin-binding protein 5/6)